MEREGRGCRGWAGRHHANCHALSRSHCHAAELSQLPSSGPRNCRAQTECLLAADCSESKAAAGCSV